MLRKQYTEWWMSFFKQAVIEGYFNLSYEYHLDTARYALGSLIQNQLDCFTVEWNSHMIRKSAMAEAPGGIPNVLYEFPVLTGVDNFKCYVQDQTIQILKNQYSTKPTIVNENYKNLADALVEQHHLPTPSNLKNAIELFFSLLEILEQIF